MTPDRRIAIRGLGIVSALGAGKALTARRFRRREDGLGPLELFPHPGARDYPVCVIPEFPADLEHRCDELAMVAIREALDEAGISPGSAALRDCALLLGNTSIDLLEREEKARACFAQRIPYPPTIFGIGGVLGQMTARLAHRVGLGGPVLSFNTSCSSSANAICQGMRLLQTERVRRVLAVGVDSLTATSYYGFAALALLDPEGCRPFDRHRCGIQMGEGAAAVLLEREAAGDRAAAVLRSAVNAFDDHHPTAACPEGSGAARAMQSALERAGVGPNRIEAIKAHGTGSANNDISEARALAQTFGDDIPPFTSLKRYVGHTMGASGALEFVAFVACVRDGFVPASLGYSSNDPAFAASPLADHLNTDGGLFLFNSFGFGGACVSLVLEASQ